MKNLEWQNFRFRVYKIGGPCPTLEALWGKAITANFWLPPDGNVNSFQKFAGCKFFGALRKKWGT